MPPGKPDGMDVPDLVTPTPYSILAAWKDPARYNAIEAPVFQLQYKKATDPETEVVEVFRAETRQMSYSLTGK